MKTSEFDYYLPDDLIAQKPVEPRDSSRLLVYHRDTGKIEHKFFYNIIDYIEAGECLVINDTRVLPARLIGKRKKTGSKVEILLLEELEKNIWEIIAKPGKKVRTGAEILFSDGDLEAKVLDVLENGNRILEFKPVDNFYERLDSVGDMPLPPYIYEKLDNKERYQTVYGHNLGSAAAPTAGLHFTPELLDSIGSKGVNFAEITLHVGLGTFRPVKAEVIKEHHMHSEFYYVNKETAYLINDLKKKSSRTFAVGTTALRTLETLSDDDGFIGFGSGRTDIFIYPGYRFKATDALITNFHLPKSTLLMLVSAFVGKEKALEIYNLAVKMEYRFFSFGDAMLIL